MPKPTKNPYPQGSARYKLWNRREKARRAKVKAKPKKPTTPKDKSKRRAYIDDVVSGAQTGKKKKKKN